MIRIPPDTARLFLAGYVLMVLQLLLIRELSSALLSCELTMLLIIAAYWSGMALGYSLSRRLSWNHLDGIVFVTFLFHASLSVVRLWPLAGIAWGLRGWALVGWVYLLVLPLPLLYSAILPRIVAQRQPEALMTAYRIELLGALTGLGSVGLGSLSEAPWAWWGYAVAVTALTCSLLSRRWLRGVVVLTVLGYVPWAGSIATWQTTRFYERLKGLSVQEIVHSSDSWYQKVELIRDTDGDLRCFLNGLEYFNTGELEVFNVILSEIPSMLVRPSTVLIVGAGSMSSLAHVRPHAETITLVELDRRVYEVSRRYLQTVHGLEQPPPPRLIVDDIKHVLRTSSETFDLIILDLPAPIYIQTGLLYTQEFYAQVRAHLRPHGVVALYASGWFVKQNPIARQIVAAVAAAFPACYVVSEFSRGLTFLVAGESLPFSPHQLAEAFAKRFPEDDIWVYPREEALRQIVQQTPPMSRWHPRAIVEVNHWLLKQLWEPKPVIP